MLFGLKQLTLSVIVFLYYMILALVAFIFGAIITQWDNTRFSYYFHFLPFIPTFVNYLPSCVMDSRKCHRLTLWQINMYLYLRVYPSTLLTT